MYKQFYANMDLATLPIVVMLFFIGVFATVLYRLTRQRYRAELEQAACLPLNDDTPAAPPSSSTAEDFRR